MRLYDKDQISEDTLSEPKQVRFSEAFEDIELTLIKESITRTEKFPVGTNSISMGNVAQGKFLYIKPAANVSVSMDGGPLMVFRANKATRMWVDFTSLDITVATDPAFVTILLAGE
jgi:hypothetical protein